MPTLLQRIREAVAPQYVVETELARGGMGIVFLARDPLLDRHVAIKVLAPDQATETAARRFIREARILARLHHPHIVPVHQVGESQGLFYYVMDYFGDATLADRLSAGPMPAKGVLKLGRDVLDALEAAHDHHVIHCDIKPSNIFLDADRALLGDFGIATPTADSDETLTEHGLRGTPRYMAPEQFTGEPVAQTDLFAVGMVLYEALTGRPWEAEQEPKTADWAGVPNRMRRVLSRALVPAPSNRWPDARSFRRAWWRTRTQEYWWRAAALTAGGLAVGALGTWMVFGGGGSVPSGDLVRIGPFATVAPPESRPVSDSVRSAFATALRASPDLQVCRDDRCEAPVVLTGTVTVDDSLTIEVKSSGPTPAIYSRRSAPAADWREVTDLVTADILLDLWSEQSPLAAWLPVRALPSTAPGRTAFIHAERLWHRGEWSEARLAYERTFRIDSTCVLCSWRITEMQRWLSEDPDPTHLENVLANPQVFSGNYQPLTVARTLPLDRRVALLDSLIREQPGFFLAWFARGDEMIHRGPLLGRLPSDALRDFAEVTALTTGFSPVYEHLLWLYTALGQRDSAAAARQRLNELPPPGDPATTAYRTLLNLGFLMRFDPEGGATALEAVSSSEAFADRRTPAAPRLMITFGAPRGAIAFGAFFESMAARPRLQFSGQVAQFVGHMASGRLQEADRVASRVFPPRPELTSFAAQVQAAHTIFDPNAPQSTVVAVAERLLRAAQWDSGSAVSVAAEGSAWLYELLAIRFPTLVAPLPTDIVSHPMLRTVLLSVQRGRTDATAAMRMLDSLRTDELRADVPGVERSPFNVYPLLRAVTHLLRAEWLAELDASLAVAELRWHYHLYLPDLPTDEPVPPEADWALGTLARWRTARLLDLAGMNTPELCDTYREVAERWAEADVQFRDRAVTARERGGALGCPRG